MPKARRPTINARSKGIRGEHQVRDFLKSLGYTESYRTAQRKGTGTNDVTCPELPNLHIEAKLWAEFKYTKLHDAIMQAARDSEGKSYCVIWRCTHDTPLRKEWHVSWILGTAIVTNSGGFKELLERLNNGRP